MVSPSATTVPAGSPDINLRPDDDFEAFRHIARYTPSIDVSVLVGEDGPRLVAQKISQGSSSNFVRPCLRLFAELWIDRNSLLPRSVRGSVVLPRRLHQVPLRSLV